jgi:zinc D-Ala-D-Ala carboxypeptidase
MQLTRHFTLAELVHSPTALRRGLDNTPSPAVVRALTNLCVHVLEPVRARFGPVAMTSGYRAPAVNAAVGGSRDSQHCRGEAGDFRVPGVRNLEVCQWIQRHLRYDQLIYEFGEAGWVHASWREGRLRQQDLTARRGRNGTEYPAGLIS